MARIIKIETKENGLVGFFKQGNKTLHYKESLFTYAKSLEYEDQKVFTKVKMHKNIEEAFNNFVEKYNK